MFTHSDLAALKRSAKKASKTDHTLSHAQHLDRLSRERFGVRNYHEFQKRVQSGLRPLKNFLTDGSVLLDFSNAEHSKLTPLDEGKLLALTQWKKDNPSAGITDWPEWHDNCTGLTSGPPESATDLNHLLSMPIANPVIAVVGSIGTGKTTNVLSAIMKSNLKYRWFEPRKIGEPFTTGSLHSDTNIFVIDEVAQWDRESLHSGLSMLVGVATKQGKQLIVILQSNRQLNELTVSGCFLNQRVSVVEVNQIRP